MSDDGTEVIRVGSCRFLKGDEQLPDVAVALDPGMTGSGREGGVRYPGADATICSHVPPLTGKADFRRT